MRTLFAALVLVMFAGVAFGEGKFTVAYPAESGSSGSSVPGLGADGYGDETTVNWLKSLTTLRGLPDYPRVYVSADAGGDIPALGDDANPGTFSAPIRTLGLVETLTNAGSVIIVFDSQDSWDQNLDTSGGDNRYVLSGTPCEAGTDVCVAWVNTSPTSAPTIDCNGLFSGAALTSTGLFIDNRTTDTGAWAFEPMILENCPPTNASNQDIHRNDGPTERVVLGVKVEGLQGSSNQLYTSHNTNTSTRSRALFLGPVCNMIDEGECFRDAGNSNRIIIGGQLTNSDDLSMTAVQIGGADAGANPVTNTTIIGSRVSQNASLTAGRQMEAFVVNAVANEVQDSWVSHVATDGWGNSNLSSVFNYGISVAATTDLTLYRNSASAADYFFIATNASAADTSSVVMHCNLLDGILTSLFNVWSGSCDGMDVTATSNVFDEANAVTAYSIEGNAATDAAGFVTDSTTQSCRNAPWRWDGTPTTFDPFDTRPKQPWCQSAAASCRAACTVAITRTFPDGQTIPKWVTGADVDIVGFRFNAGTNVGP